MRTKSFSAGEVARLILNVNNPKTMDYYFLKFMGVNTDAPAHLNWAGGFTVHMTSLNNRLSHCFQLSANRKRVEKEQRGNIYFILDVTKDQILPKSRTLRIVRRKFEPVQVPNPNRGKTKKITYGNGYVQTYLEQSFIQQNKELLLYCRNSWDRKGEIKQSKPKKDNGLVHQQEQQGAAVGG